MATGWLESGICYSVQQDAVDHHFQAILPYVSISPIDTIKIDFFRDNLGVWNIQKQTFSSTGARTDNFTVAAQLPTFASCEVPNDPVTNFNDGMTLGWAVAAAMVLVYVIRRPYR